MTYDDHVRLAQKFSPVGGLNYSVYWTPFTARPDDYQPAGGGMPNLLAAITESALLAKRNTIDALVTGTGGRRYKFLTQSNFTGWRST